MNIDLECCGLLALILQDSPKDRQYILCVLARSNSIPIRIHYDSKYEYPTFYSYSNIRIPLYLMGEGVLSNVPRQRYAKRLISSQYLSLAEALINKAKNSNTAQKLESVSKFINLENKTAYNEAETFLVFRDKATAFIQNYSQQNKATVSSFLGQELSKQAFKDEEKAPVSVTPAEIQITEPSWSQDFHWEGKSLIFGSYGKITLNSRDTRTVFKELFRAKGNWVELKKLRELTGKDIKKYIRPTIGQIQRSMKSELKKHISFPSTTTDNLLPKPRGGAYRIKYSP